MAVEYSDDALDAGRRTQMEAHLSNCRDCARLMQEMTEARNMLRTLPQQQTSAQFEAHLADRLSLVGHPAAHTPWWARLAASLHQPPKFLRPALALGTAAAAIGCAIFVHTPGPTPAPVIAQTDDALISQCVTLHQRDVATQPLSDSTAQNLAVHQSEWAGDTAANAQGNSF